MSRLISAALGYFLTCLSMGCAIANAQTGSVWNPPPKNTYDAEGRSIWRKGLDEPPQPAPAPVAAEPVPAPVPTPPPAPVKAPEQPATPAPKITVSDKYIALDLGKVAVFEFNSARLDAGSLKRINSLASVLMKVESRWQSIEVAGHSDTVGNQAANLDISSRRAKSVKEVLIRAGVPANRIESKGYGATQLLSGIDGANESQRRVEVRFLGVKESARAGLAEDLGKAMSAAK